MADRSESRQVFVRRSCFVIDEATATEFTGLVRLVDAITIVEVLEVNSFSWAFFRFQVYLHPMQQVEGPSQQNFNLKLQ